MLRTALNSLQTPDLGPMGIDPEHRFHYKILDRPDQLSPRFCSALNGVVATVRELLKRVGLPDDLAENAYYKAFLLDVIPDPDETAEGTPIERYRVIWNRLPFRPNYETANGNLNRVSDRVLAFLEEKSGDLGANKDLIRQNIHRAVTYLMDDGTRGVHNYPLNRRDILDPKDPDKRGKAFSMETLRKAVITIQADVLDGERDEENALINLLTTLGILDEEEGYAVESTDRKRKELERKLNEASVKAWTLYDVIQNVVNKVIDSKLVANGFESSEIETLGTSALIRQLDLFHLLEVVFTGKVSGIAEYSDRRFSEADRHEAQIIAAHFHDFLEVSEDSSFKHTKSLLRSLERSFRNGLFEPVGSHHRQTTLYSYEDGKFSEKTRKRSPELSKLKPIPGFEAIDPEEQLVHFIYIRPKGRTATVLRRITRSPEIPVAKVPDAIAGRMVLWGISLNEILQNPGKQEYVRAIALRAGSSLGLEYNSSKDNKKATLNPGEFCVESKLNEPYPTFKVYGCLKAYPDDQVGVRCEIQIITKDVEELVSAKSSPLDHEVYDKRRKLQAFLMEFPASQYAEQRKIVRDELQRMKQEREKALVALRERLETGLQGE